MADFAGLTFAAFGFFAIHIGLAGTTLRDRVAGRIGDVGFQVLFSILSIFLLIWMVSGYRNAPASDLWDIPLFTWLPILVSPFSAILLVAAFSGPNATGAGGGKALRRDHPDRGIFRVTRHPFLVGVVLWASAHMLANGDAASLLLFGSLLATSVFGPASIDAKLRRRAPDDFARLAACTSIIPFAAIIQGRTKFSFSEIGLVRIVAGLALYGALFYLHEYISGVAIHVS